MLSGAFAGLGFLAAFSLRPDADGLLAIGLLLVLLFPAFLWRYLYFGQRFADAVYRDFYVYWCRQRASAQA